MGRARVRPARGPAARLGAARGSAGRVPRRAVGVSRQASPGAGAGRCARNREGPAWRLPPGARRDRDQRARCGRGDRRRRARLPLHRDPPARSDGDARARVPVPCGIHRVFTRADDAWRAELASSKIADLVMGVVHDAREPPSKKAPAGSPKRSANPLKRATGVSIGSVRPVTHAGSSVVAALAAGAGALAVVGLVPAGLDLALLGLFAHEEVTLSHR